MGNTSISILLLLWLVISIIVMVFTIWALMWSPKVRETKDRTKKLGLELKKNNQPSFKNLYRSLRTAEMKVIGVLLDVLYLIVAVSSIFTMGLLVQTKDLFISLIIIMTYLLVLWMVIRLMKENREHVFIVIKNNNEPIYSEIAQLWLERRELNKKMLYMYFTLFASFLFILALIGAS